LGCLRDSARGTSQSAVYGQLTITRISENWSPEDSVGGKRSVASGNVGADGEDVAFVTNIRRFSRRVFSRGCMGFKPRTNANER
jgi:hypothetical protein